MSWIALVLALVGLAGIWWIRDVSRAVAELPAPDSSGAAPVPGASAGLLKEAERALAEQPPSPVDPSLVPPPQSHSVDAPASLGIEKRSLRPATSPARPSSGQRLGVAPADALQVDALQVDALVLPEHAAPDAAVAGANLAETESEATAPPVLRAPSSRAEDPWNPTSFGERR
jgi:hypothetical protein